RWQVFRKGAAMTQRERSLAIGMLVAAVLGGAVCFFYKVVWAPLQELDTSILTLQQDIEQKEERMHETVAGKARLERWRLLSLPSNLDFSRREYHVYLSDLLLQSGFTSIGVMPKPPELSSVVLPNKERVYTRLPFVVTGRATLANLVYMLESFYRTSL